MKNFNQPTNPDRETGGTKGANMNLLPRDLCNVEAAPGANSRIGLAHPAATLNLAKPILAGLLAGVALAGAGQSAAPPAPEYPLMRFNAEQKLQFAEEHLQAPEAVAPAKGVAATFPKVINLLPWLPYAAWERNQGHCGNCWQWAGTGVMEIALNTQTGFRSQLSVQFLNACNTRKNCCQGGWLKDLSDFYSGKKYVVPWTNHNAEFLSRYGSCGEAPCGSIATTPRYALKHISTVKISTHGVGQAQAVANIKKVLSRNQAVWFAFFMPSGRDWHRFFNYWDHQYEEAVWSDFGCGGAPDPWGGGHAVLCVGYNEEDPNNRYWIMVNSWGTARGRPNGVFLVAMDLDYDCEDADGWPSLYWQTLDVEFSGRDLPGDLEVAIIPPEAVALGAQWRVDDGPWQASGARLSGLTGGRHTVTWKPLPGWTTPPAQVVELSFVAPASLVGAYAVDTGNARFDGLFCEPTGVRHGSSDDFTLATTRSRTFSGSLRVEGVRYALAGRLDQLAHAVVNIPRSGRAPLTVKLDLDRASLCDRITGAVTDGTWTADLHGNRRMFNARTNPAPAAGRYTLVIPGTGVSEIAPTGDGWAWVAVDGSGKVTIAGALADGTPLSQSSWLSRDGYFPLYVPLYGGAGSVLSWINFSRTPGADVWGDVNWIKPRSSGEKTDPDGFALRTMAWGARYRAPAAGTSILSTSSAVAVFSGGGWGDGVTNRFRIGSDNKVTALSGARLSLAFTASTGVFKGSIGSPGAEVTLPFRGVVVQHVNLGCGFFTCAGRSGRVLLAPGY
jgi:hypothetical protein